jgi:hypothetical protein
VHDKRKCTVALPSKANDFNDQLNGTDYSGTANG